jgi:hypothetical protein
VRAYVCIYVCRYVQVCVCMYVCVCVYHSNLKRVDLISLNPVCKLRCLRAPQRRTFCFPTLMKNMAEERICSFGMVSTKLVGRESLVGIRTRYGKDGPGIEYWWGRDFPHPSRPALGPTQPPTQWVPGFSRV